MWQHLDWALEEAALLAGVHSHLVGCGWRHFLPSYVSWPRGLPLVCEHNCVKMGGEQMSVKDLQGCEYTYTPSTTTAQQATRTHYDSMQFPTTHSPEHTDCLPCVYLGSVLPSSRSVIEGTTRIQSSSHTSNRLAYSLTDTSKAGEQGWKG